MSLNERDFRDQGRRKEMKGGHDAGKGSRRDSNRSDVTCVSTGS